MDFRLPERLRDLLPAMEAFVAQELYPLEADFLHQGAQAILPALQEKRALVKAKGWWAPQMHHEWGGMGLNLQEHGLVSEVLGRSPLGHYVFNCQAPDSGNMELLAMFGTEAQKEQFLRPLAAGEIRSCFSMTEPGRAGSNPVMLDTTAVKDGSDYVINGHKWFTSSAEGAAFAIVMAITNPEAAPHQRASQIIVPLKTPGFELVRNIPIMGEAGSDYFSHAEVKYTNCRVPQSYLLGAEGAGFTLAQERLGPGRIHHCMRWIGICRRAFDLMCQRAATRELAEGEVLGTKQIVQAWIAESKAEIEAARLMVLQAAWMIDTLGMHAAREQISLIKFYVANVMLQVIDRAIQAHGALGITEDTVLSFFYRHERGARIYDGPDEVHKMVVAKHLLKKAFR